MHKAIKYTVIGVSLIVAGLTLNHLAMWAYEQSIPSYPGVYPNPGGPLVGGTLYLALIPIGLIFLAYSGYLMFGEYRMGIIKK